MSDRVFMWLALLLLMIGCGLVVYNHQQKSESPVITSIFCQQKDSTFRVKKPEGSKTLTYYIKDSTIYVDNGLGEYAFWTFQAPAMCFINVPVQDAPAPQRKPQGRDI